MEKVGHRAARLPKKSCACVGAAIIFLIALSSISLPLGPVRSSLAATLIARLPGTTSADIGALSASVAGRGGVAIKALDMTIGFDNGLSIETGCAILTASRSDLLRGRITARALELEDLHIVSRRRPRGQGPARAIGVSERVEGMRDDLRRLENQLIARGFESLSVSRVTIDAFWWPAHLPPVNSLTWRPGEGVKATFVTGEGVTTNVTLLDRADVEAGSETALSISGMPPSFLSQRIGNPELKPYFDAPISVDLRLSFDPQGSFAGGWGGIRLEEGYLMVGHKDAMLVEGGVADIRIPPRFDRVIFAGGQLSTYRSQLTFAGELSLPKNGPLPYTFMLGQGYISSSPTKAPLRIEEGQIDGSYSATDRLLLLDTVTFVTDEGTISASGGAYLKGRSPAIFGVVSLPKMSSRAFSQAWPPFVAGDAKRWFDRHVSSGTVGPGRITVKIEENVLARRAEGAALPTDALAGEVIFSDATAQPTPAFPFFEKIEGKVRMTRQGIDVLLAKGQHRIDGGTVRLLNSHFRIPRIGGWRPTGHLEVNLAGPLRTLAQFADSSPLYIMGKIGIDPADLSGGAAASIKTAVPLTPGRGLTAADVAFVVNLKGATSQRPIEGRKVEEANLTIKGRYDDYRISGQAVVDGASMQVDIAMSDAQKKPQVTVAVDEEARKHLGIDLTGLAEGTIVAGISEEGRGRQAFDIDLTQTTLTLDPLGWRKGGGVPARATFTMRKPKGFIRIDDFHLHGEGFDIDADILLNAGGKLVEANVKHARLRPGDDFRARLTMVGDVLKVKVEGQSFDAQGLVRVLTKQSESGPSRPNVDLRATLRRVVGRNDAVLTNVTVTSTRRNGELRQLGIFANSGPGQPVIVNLAFDESEQVVTLNAADGGLLLRFLDLYRYAVGGRLESRFRGSRGAGSGEITLHDFRIIGDPALKKLVVAAPARDNGYSASRQWRRRRNQQNPNDVPFDLLRIPLQRNGDVMEFTDAYFKGPLIGATARGGFHMKSSEVNLAGTFVPLFGMNNFVGKIPVLGALLGGEHEGLVGVTYKLSGPLTEPTLNIKPMSVIAPGIFRKFFEYR